MKKYVPIFLSALALIVSVFSLIRSQSEYANHDIVAGVLRSEDERGWYALDDEGHRPLNISAVKTVNGLIVVTYGKDLGVINTFIAVPDETFAKEGYLFGASVTGNQARITVSKVMVGTVVPVDASTIKSKKGNVWVYGVFEGKGKK
jgi:hypothetical protein